MKSGIGKEGKKRSEAEMRSFYNDREKKIDRGRGRLRAGWLVRRKYKL